MNILRKIDTSIDKYFDKHGREPKYVIFNAEGYADFNYEMALKEGETQDDLYLTEYDSYDLLTVCITHKKDANLFDLA